jgi:dipeptidase E
MTTTTQIIGLGGGGFTGGKNPLLDLYILSASPVKNPKICLLPTASGDNGGLIQYFQSVFSEYPCQTRYLELMHPRIADMEKFLLDCDIIYVSGGTTKSMLGLWREWGVDKILKKAYDKGIVLAGVSAGFVCWFETCVTDSIPHKLTAMECLGFLEGSGCPHFDSTGERGNAYRRLLKRGELTAGYAAEDGAGLHFIDGKLVRAIAAFSDSKAYHLSKDEDDVITEEALEMTCLSAEENFNKYIAPLFPEESESTEEITEADFL